MTENPRGIPEDPEGRERWIAEKIAEMPDRLKSGGGESLAPYLVCERCGKYDRSNRWLPVRGRYCDCEQKRREAFDAISRTDVAGEMTFDNLKDSDPSIVAAAEKLLEAAIGDRERGLFMLGLPGRGKTHLSIACVRAALAAGRVAGYFNVAELVSRIQSTYGMEDSADTKAGVISSVAEHDLVVLDDVGKEHVSADVQSIVYQLVDGIYRAKKTLVASSNLPGKDFVTRYDGAVLSRLGGMCEKVVIRGEDRRAARWEW